MDFKRTLFGALVSRSALVEEKVFQDPTQAEPLSLRLRATGSTDEGFRIREKAQEFVELYVDGVAGIAPAPVPIGEGAFLSPTKMLCGSIAMLWVLQYPPDDCKPYTFNELAMASEYMPLAFTSAVNWAHDIRTRAALGSKNSSGADTENQSEPPSATEQSVTPA